MAPSKKKPDISGVPEEIRKNIVKDILNKPIVNSLLSNKKVGISVSDNEELNELGFSNIHLRDITIEITRQLLINGAVMVYGGDLRNEGFTEIISELAYQYRSKNEGTKNHFINYFSFPIYHNLKKSHRLEFKKNRTEVVTIAPPSELGRVEEKFIQPDTPENNYIWAKSLTHMRHKMISNSDARIFIGGKTNNYLGKMPGIIEEALIAFQLKKPVYLVGGLGGAAKEIINAIQGIQFSFHQTEFHLDNEYKNFKSYYNEHTPNDPIDLAKVENYFQNICLDNLSELNGLSVEENKRLFTTPHIPEIIFYIFKGLKRVNNQT